MKEIYVKLDKKDGYYLAVLIHYYPFHSKRGLGKTREELLKNNIVENKIKNQLKLHCD